MAEKNDTDLGPLTDSQPSSDEVRAELVELRQYQGITIMRVRDLAPKIQR